MEAYPCCSYFNGLIATNLTAKLEWGHEHLRPKITLFPLNQLTSANKIAEAQGETLADAYQKLIEGGYYANSG